VRLVPPDPKVWAGAGWSRPDPKARRSGWSRRIPRPDGRRRSGNRLAIEAGIRPPPTIPYDCRLSMRVRRYLAVAHNHERNGRSGRPGETIPSDSFVAGVERANWSSNRRKIREATSPLFAPTFRRACNFLSVVNFSGNWTKSPGRGRFRVRRRTGSRPTLPPGFISTPHHRLVNATAGGSLRYSQAPGHPGQFLGPIMIGRSPDVASLQSGPSTVLAVLHGGEFSGQATPPWQKLSVRVVIRLRSDAALRIERRHGLTGFLHPGDGQFQNQPPRQPRRKWNLLAKQGRQRASNRIGRVRKGATGYDRCYWRERGAAGPQGPTGTTGKPLARPARKA